MDPPIRLCCGTRHVGVVCPDNRVMCCYCFDRVSIEQLAMEDGSKVDVCQDCWDYEQERFNASNN